MFNVNLLLFFSLFVLAIVTAQDDYVYYPEINIHYKLHKTPKNWLDAKITCSKENAVLALPTNDEEASILYGLITKPNQLFNLFVNFHDLYNEGEFVTDKGTPLQYFYHKFADNQPDNYEGSENCGCFRYVDGRLNDYSCIKELQFVCQKQNVSYESTLFSNLCQNDDPEYKLESFSGKYFKFHMYPRTWNQARSVCRAENSRLAVVESKQEEDFLVNMVNNPQNKMNHVYDYVFLGIHNFYKEGHFYTVSGEPVSNDKYMRWLAGKPDNQQNNEHCGSITPTGALDDIPCSYNKPFFCEKENVFPINPRIEGNFTQ